ncbi:SIR2 family protein [Microbacterium sp. 179-B 1A2 NHS]|uniref:SIR2 family protein n=1 Tax=Microbacterium sp. 179-B 1A2 NHS TaxID=3142383 RepID=UPI0039A0455D
MAFADDLVAHLSRVPAAPFLFVGSGFSRRYVNADDWGDLLRRFADLTGKPYERYYSKASGNYPQIASLIAEDFHDVWWDDAAYAHSRTANPAPRGDSSPLKIEISSYFAQAPSRLPADGPLRDELELLKKATIEGIITTNFDPLLETLFEEYSVFSGQDELLFHEPQGVGEIYKIHGSCDDPESIVITAEDYARLDERNVYLAAKLLTTFVEHPVIFIGYSLTDTDVQRVLTNIAHVLTTENLSKLQDRLIFVQWDPNAPEPALISSPFAADGMAIPMLRATVRDFEELFTALGSLRRRFPVKFLRQLKEQVYELVQTSKPTGTLYVSDLDADTDTSQVDVVIGVGVKNRLAQQGIVGIERQELQTDLLQPFLPFDDKESMAAIVTGALPRHLRNRANTPIYRYLRGAGMLNDDGTIRDDVTVPKPVRDRVAAATSPLRSPGSYIRRAAEHVAEAGDFKTLVSTRTTDEVLFAAAHMDLNRIQAEDLRKFLLGTRDEAMEGNSLQAAQWGKCLCLYDYLVYRHLPSRVASAASAAATGSGVANS